MTNKEAPPIHDRPRCLGCGKRLKPNYDTEELKTGKTRKVYRFADPHHYYGEAEIRAIREDDYGAKQDDKGRWYVTRTVTQKERKWRGTFGRYGDGFFCGLNCAHRWAIKVAIKLAKEDRQLITYDKQAVKD